MLHHSQNRQRTNLNIQTSGLGLIKRMGGRVLYLLILNELTDRPKSSSSCGGLNCVYDLTGVTLSCLYSRQFWGYKGGQTRHRDLDRWRSKQCNFWAQTTQYAVNDRWLKLMTDALRFLLPTPWDGRMRDDQAGGIKLNTTSRCLMLHPIADK